MNTERWQTISYINDHKTHIVPATWALDKYPDTGTLTSNSKVVVLDQDGRGVDTLFHVSDYKNLACEERLYFHG